MPSPPARDTASARVVVSCGPSAPCRIGSRMSSRSQIAVCSRVASLFRRGRVLETVRCDGGARGANGRTLVIASPWRLNPTDPVYAARTCRHRKEPVHQERCHEQVSVANSMVGCCCCHNRTISARSCLMSSRRNRRPDLEVPGSATKCHPFAKGVAASMELSHSVIASELHSRWMR